MTQEDRERLAARLIREERVRFSGVAKDAYTAAGVNPATWKRVTEAQTIKPHKLIQIVARLWPETTGDWTQIPGLNPPAVDRGHGYLADLIDRYVDAHPQVTNETIAGIVGVSTADVKRWRTNKLSALPLAKHLERLAALLGVSEDEIFDAALIDGGYRRTPAEPVDPSQATPTAESA
jgi:transcriptional regulator with XRE-family HTH domain